MPKKTKPSVQTYQRKAADPAAITPIEYGGLQSAFDHLNRALFDGALPDIFITYQRQANSKGYFSENSFASRDGTFRKPEVALNPDAFIDRTDEQIVSTLAHEMVHLWQYSFGKPGSRGYHNKEWAAKMKSLGLMPSSTGAVGGKETGQRMTHYIIPGGAYAQTFATFAAGGWKLNLQSTIHAGGSRAPNSKLKFTCPGCAQNAWGKPDLAILCELCGLKMRDANAADDPEAMTAQSYLPQTITAAIDPPTEAQPTKRQRGRPKGSKNRPKETDASLSYHGRGSAA